MNAESEAHQSIRDVRRLVRTAACLFGLSLINGLATQATRLPRLARSGHLVGLIGSSFPFGLAAVWPRLTYRPTVSRTAAGLAIFGFVAGWLLYLTAAFSGAAGLFPLGGGVRVGALFALIIFVRHASASVLRSNDHILRGNQ